MNNELGQQFLYALYTALLLAALTILCLLAPHAFVRAAAYYTALFTVLCIALRLSLPAIKYCRSITQKYLRIINPVRRREHRAPRCP